MAKFPVAVHDKIFGRSPQDVVAVHPLISNGRSLKIGCFFALAVHPVRSLFEFNLCFENKVIIAQAFKPFHRLILKSPFEIFHLMTVLAFH